MMRSERPRSSSASYLFSAPPKPKVIYEKYLQDFFEISHCGGGHDNNLSCVVENNDDDDDNDDEDSDPFVQANMIHPSHSFLIFGTDENNELSAQQQPQHNIIYPSLMESLRNFFPYVISEDNFWLKYSLVRDGASLSSLLSTLRVHPRTLVAIETTDGEIFGSFTSAPWRRNGQTYFGRGESFLWRLRQNHPGDLSHRGESCSQVEVYPFTGANSLEQLCNDDRIAVGGDYVVSPLLAESATTATGLMGVHGIELEPSLCHGCSAGTATYNNPRLTRNPSGKFTVANLEVWTTTPCYTEDAAKQMERRRTFVQRNGAKRFNSISISSMNIDHESHLVCRD
eukprot:CAMPEP_0194290232 /NCGR_PEP_ID=MMETSP0169-20130528/40797_1 /TAXON_ID=218684 /ORGANISM="Corethron pennatum, Strain L29A3" /LENGTH=340 /DNA_ID=CAMNT_0039037765 /DNA_START=191 /DNA_END=1210 /DNA_ORIENTATION=-